MRQKKPTLFFSFAATAAAMEAERLCKENDLPGRLVPVPRQITAGCGLAWMTKPDEGETVRTFLESHGVEYQDCVMIDF